MGFTHSNWPLLCTPSSPSSVLFVALILSYKLFYVVGVPATIVTPPKSINTTVCDEEVTLSCVVMAESLLFFVDDENADTVPNFHQSGIVSNGSLKMRNLTVPVSLDISSSSIVCIGFNLNIDPSQNSSDPAIITIQGPLNPPTMVMYNAINSFALRISWTPPPTLVGTTIRGFNVTSSTGDSVFTSDDSVILRISNHDNCVPINITITPDNCIDGDPATLTGIYLPSLPSSIQEILVSYRPLPKALNGAKRRILLTVDVTNLCPSEVPTSIVVSTSAASYTFGLIPSCDSTLLNSNVTIELNENEIHYVSIGFQNQLGDYGITSDMCICTNCSFAGQNVGKDFTSPPLTSTIITTIPVTPTETQTPTITEPNTYTCIIPITVTVVLVLVFLLVVGTTYCCISWYLSSRRMYRLEDSQALYYDYHNEAECRWTKLSPDTFISSKTTIIDASSSDVRSDIQLEEDSIHNDNTTMPAHVNSEVFNKTSSVNTEEAYHTYNSKDSDLVDSKEPPVASHADDQTMIHSEIHPTVTSLVSPPNLN